MTRRTLILGVAVLTALGAAAYVRREELVLSSLALATPKRSLDEQIALIEPGIEIFTPEAGAGPWPALLQFHGCSGFRRDWMKGWATIANEAGFLVIVVDSNGPRGIDRERALKTVCGGKELIGQERAGDIAAAIEIARRRADVDAAKIVVAGWSHGAWSVMDYLALEGANRAPSSLDARPEGPPLAGAILFYPYCGEGTWSRLHAWRQEPPTLAFVAARDSVVSPEECRVAAAKLAREGVAIDLVEYAEADHAFDDVTLLGGPYAYFYHAPSAADAGRRVSAFLKSVAQK